MSETTTFADFGVDASIISALSEAGITSPFPIQELTLPLALSGADIIGQARTGTGKTLGFGIPLLQRVAPGGSAPQALVIVPTRELCLQVATDLAYAGRDRGVAVVAVYGGKAIGEQADALQAGADVVVGTPGRLLDMLRRRQLTLSEVRALVLDEADEMLDLGFLPDVEQLIAATSPERQTLLFSATMPGEVVALARRYMRKPTFLRADVEEVRIAPETRQFFFSCHRMDKPAVISRLLQDPSRGLALIFCRTKRMADILAEELREHDVKAAAIHSDLRQEARERALDRFRKGKIDVLVATEVAARGLDIESVTHVVNYDCPDDEKMYLHRIGRTGRAGATGVAVTLAVWNELPRLEMIRRELAITEEIQEIFSTSPLLDELFDLPAREARRQPAAPPKARGAAKGRGEAGERGAAPRGRAAKGSAGEEAAVGALVPARGRDADDAEERPRSRGRRRRGGAGRQPAPALAAEAEVGAPGPEVEEDAAEARQDAAAAKAGAGAVADEAVADVAAEEAGALEVAGEDAAPRARRRSRRRASEPARSVDGGAEPDGEAAADDVERGEPEAVGAMSGEDGDQAVRDASARRRKRTRVGPTAPPRSPGERAGQERRTRTRPAGDRGRATGADRSGFTAARGDDGDGRAGRGEPATAGRGGRETSGPSERRTSGRNDGASTRRGERASTGRDGRGKGERGGARDGRRGRSERDGRAGDRSRRGDRPYGKDRRPRRPAVDPEVARGTGTPRTTRPMVITHLP